MGASRAAVVCLSLLGSVVGSVLQRQLRAPPGTTTECKTICQRFGMRALGKWKPEFTSMKSPVECSKHCDEVFPAAGSLLQRKQHAPPQSADECKTTCQRFGMKVLGEWKPEFKSITSPVECSKHCDQVFASSGSLLQKQKRQPPKTVKECKSICQRFGMKVLGDWKAEFAQMKSPFDCSNHCEEVLPSPVKFLQQQMHTQPETAVACKTICQRFGMKALGKWKPEFTSMKSPVECSKHCDEVFLAGGSLLQRKQHAPPQSATECKTTCQRFGMKVLGEWKPEFKSITSPVECSKHCDQVFASSGSLLQKQKRQPPKTVKECKSICQRFGMKVLGDWKAEFAQMKSPFDCSNHCEEVLPSPVKFLQQQMHTQPETAVACKTICQRFGMKALGKWKPEFTSMKSPVECSKHCDEVFLAGGSLLQRKQHAPPQSATECKTTCQRFGMKVLGEWKPEFKSMNPVECSKHCDQVFASNGSLLQMKTHPPPTTVKECQTTCQRFGMKILGEWKAEFATMKSPVECSKHCEEVLG
eukprot:TRINITY_DN4072_c0_g1_i1.p1 TRINITY_DN4072_c0_g1~~TRINITY_DN4072_c0_g1_i1.p1  ORF type:complete len:529 (-),score=104.67 TRINITY_DN4072_c0_g1_i1:176-1762(-)